MDTIDAMRVFAAVARSGSFSAGARRLGISKALASKAIAKLEGRLGARLLQRTTRSLSLTEIGESYLGRSIALLAQLDEMEQEASGQRGTLCGVLRVAAPPAFGETALAEAVATFMVRHPELRVELVLDARTVDVVAEGFDHAVRVAALADSSLVARRIAPHPFVLCASPAYLRRAGRPEVPADLARHVAILDSAISPTGQWSFVVDGRAVAFTVPLRARVDSARATATLVRAGIGIGLLVQSVVRDDLAAGRLVRRLEAFDAYDRSVYAIYPAGRHLPAKVRLFVDHLVATFADEARSAIPRRGVRPASRSSRQVRISSSKRSSGEKAERRRP
jgi:DNA-binding transcriptional LysR family regulator